MNLAITEATLPMVIMPLTFLFVLLIILIAKAPKIGAWLVGGLVLLAPVALWRLAATGALRQEEAIPLIVMPATFLFVLMVILLAKAPKVGAGLIVALIAMVVLGVLFVPFVAYQRTSHGTPAVDSTVALVKQQTEQGAGSALVEQRVQTVQMAEKVWEGYMKPPAVPVPPVPEVASAPIWSPGMEQEFEADVYPSGLAAATALGRRVVKSIRALAGDPNEPVKVIVFQEGNDRGLVSVLAHALEKELPGVSYSLEADLRNIGPGEVGLTLRREAGMQEERRRNTDTGLTIVESVEGGRMVAAVFNDQKRRASAEASYIDKPWVESFGTFASTKPDQSLVIARSNGACMSEGEAHEQALAGVHTRVAAAIGRYGGRGRLAPEAPITTTDILNGGFIVDRFVQSFETTTGRVWRQAILVDVSGSKLAELRAQKVGESRQIRTTWARMGFSAIGVIVLIGAIYFFLNMATRGYYEWSLRIAGVVLIVVAVISILMVVR